MIGLIIVFLVSGFLSLGAVALILKISHKKSWYDHINERKIHSGDIPRLGGIGFALAFILVAVTVVFSTRKYDPMLRFLPCLGALLFTLGFGVFDDFRPLSPRYRFLIQLLAALCVIIPGYHFRRVVYFDAGLLSNLPIWLSWIFTLLWLVGLPNAMNFIDGTDGLAGGLAAIIALFMGIIFFSFAETPSAEILCASLFGVMLGFLVFNAPIPKAKIFMGDGGSQFLGLCLGILPLLDKRNTTASLPVPYAAALLAIPIFDTTAAVWRRLRDGRRIYSPDKFHVHHKLYVLGCNARGVVLILYGLQIVLGVLTFVSIRLNGTASLVVLAAAYIAATGFFATVHFAYRKKLEKDPHAGD